MRPITHLVASCLAALRSAATLPAGGLRIVSYHAVGTELPFAHYGISIDAGSWREQILLMKQDVVPLRPGSSGVALTFDDGYADLLTNVIPLLVELSLPVTLFLTVDHVRTGAPLYLRRDDVASLAALPNVTIGAHGVSHRRLTSCSDADLERELVESRKLLEDWTQREITALAYPHGAVDRRVRDAAEAAGYRIGCTTRFGLNREARDPLLLCRTEIIASDSPRDVERKLAGAWDWWAWRHRDPASV